MRIVCIIQARMGSTRLPGKVAMDICGKTMLERVVERARDIEGVDEVVVATSTASSDDRIIELCKGKDIRTFRGSEEDVLERYIGAARAHDAEVVVRVTSDCPLLDPIVSSVVVRRFSKESPDYASNTIERTYPRGLDTEILSLDALEMAGREATEKPDREHVTLFVWRQPERFKVLSIRGVADNSGHRWTVDTPEDLEFVRRIYGELGDANIESCDVLALLNMHPEWVAINKHIEQKIH